MIIYRVSAQSKIEFLDQWQREMSQAVAGFAGFIDQATIPPNPPSQTQWVILQWFQDTKDALGWLNSPERSALVTSTTQNEIHIDEIHVVPSESTKPQPGVSAIITTRVKPGAETAYQDWQRKIAAAHANAKGFRGYRFEAPVSTASPDWLIILRFDTSEDLQVWMGSPARLKLLEEAVPLTEETRVRVTRSAFDEWFQLDRGPEEHPAWKMSMLVLLVIYPLVFIFDQAVAGPIFARHGMPTWLSMFIGNVFCVTMVSQLIPWVGRRFQWWLEPPRNREQVVTLRGVLVLLMLYGATLALFAGWSSWR
jgi:antibiotic biosynthesis monooxygenase (ABM) superfamily enzyme